LLVQQRTRHKWEDAGSDIFVVLIVILTPRCAINTVLMMRTNRET